MGIVQRRRSKVKLAVETNFSGIDPYAESPRDMVNHLLRLTTGL